uniref:Uncharacterized protein n=1 Tax=Anguilla anguilla TaxID=7936 RepID=A0A0E9SFX0_ANGAN
MGGLSVSLNLLIARTTCRKASSTLYRLLAEDSM